MSWIKLVLHPDDPKVSIVAMEIGASKAEAYVAMIRWLFWLDANYGSKTPTVSAAMFRAATGWPNDKLAKAFQCEDVDWITVDCDRLAPTRPESHFSASAKRRAMDATRKAIVRTGRGHGADTVRISVAEIADAAVTRVEEREKREETDESAGGVVVGGFGDEVQEKGDEIPTLTPAQVALYRRLEMPPVGFTSPWINAETIRDLVTLPHASEPLIVEAKKRARSAERTKARNPASIAIAFLTKPDPGIAAALAAQEAQ